MKKLKFLLLLLIGSYVLPSFASTITVFAAASLTNVVDELAKNYEETTNNKILVSYASSSTLARQIEQGAPANIFISANQSWMDYLADKDLINKETRQTLLINQLVLVTHKSNKPQKTLPVGEKNTWLSLLQKGDKIAVGDPNYVPAGIYAKQALTNLRVYDKISPQFAPSSSVREALMLVERQEAKYGIIYSTDASSSKQVTIVGTFPENLLDKIEYPIAIIKGQENEAVKQFYTYLRSENALAVFKSYGFAVPIK